MPSYHLTWEIDIDAETPLAAARKALRYQRDPCGSATVFLVADETGGVTWIDLLEDDM